MSKHIWVTYLNVCANAFVCLYVCVCVFQACEMEKHCHHQTSRKQTGSNISGTQPTHIELEKRYQVY